MTPCVWLTLASATQVLWPTFDKHLIYQLQPAPETESAQMFDMTAFGRNQMSTFANLSTFGAETEAKIQSTCTDLVLSAVW